VGKEYKLIKNIWSGKYPERGNKEPLSVLEKAFMTLLIVIRSFSLGRIIKVFFISCSYKTRSGISELYVLLWFVVSLCLLFLYPFRPIWGTWILLGLVAHRTIEGLAYPLSIIFVNKYDRKRGPRSINRSLLLLMFNYCEIIIGFAIFYLATRSIGYSNCDRVITKPIEALYFSVVTITTLGYGDMRPISWFGQGLALLEPLLGFVMVIIVIGVFLTGVKGIKEKRRGN